jgi:hypothetical protein
MLQKGYRCAFYYGKALANVSKGYPVLSGKFKEGVQFWQPSGKTAA